MMRVRHIHSNLNLILGDGYTGVCPCLGGDVIKVEYLYLAIPVVLVRI
jgi:hypothetical protein